MKEEDKINFLFVGAPKCGSTWIYECLKEHPEICLISNKNQPSNDFLLNQDEEKIQQRIEKSFEKKQNKIIGELNEFYLGAGEEVIEKAKKYNPSLKIIVSLRNPVERAYSSYLCINSLRKKGWDNFEEALKKNPQLVEGGFYYKKLKKYFDVFPKENILVMNFENAEEIPQSFISEIYDFLGVSASYEPENLNIETGSTRFKLTCFARSLHHYIILPLKKIGIGHKLKSSTKARRAFYQLGSAYSSLTNPRKPEMKKETKQKLKEFYREDISKLENLVDKDLSHWKNV